VEKATEKFCTVSVAAALLLGKKLLSPE